MAAVAGCLELDPSFVDDAAGTEGGEDTAGDTAATVGSSGDEASGSAGGTATDSGAVDCSADAFEPSSYEEPADLSGMSTIAARLEGEGAEDWYKTGLDPGGPAEVFARTAGVDVQVCFFVECEGGVPGTITKCSGEPAVDPAWLTGCCASETVGVEYDCGGPTGIVAHVRVDEGDDTCPAYDLEVGIAPGG